MGKYGVFSVFDFPILIIILAGYLQLIKRIYGLQEIAGLNFNKNILEFVIYFQFELY